MMIMIQEECPTRILMRGQVKSKGADYYGVEDSIHILVYFPIEARILSNFNKKDTCKEWTIKIEDITEDESGTNHVRHGLLTKDC